MSIGCIAVDRHNCVQAINLKYLEYSKLKWAPVVFAENIDQLENIEEDKVIIYITKYKKITLDYDLSKFTEVVIILEQDSQLDVSLYPIYSKYSWQLILPESGAVFNGYVRGLQDDSLEFNFYCDQVASNTKVLLDGKFVVNSGYNLKALGTIKMYETCVSSSSELYLKALHEDSLSSIVVSPQLEVLNSKVKAKHGSAIKKINEPMLWPFLSRGIAIADALKLLKRSFLKGC